MASSPRIDELRNKFEENPRRYFAPLANEYRKAGEIDQAIAICREYLPQQPGHMSGHIVYGQALYEAKQFEESKAVFETALSLDPENLIALRHLGDIALVIGDAAGARGWYGRVLEADPRNEEIQAQLAKLDAAPPSAPAAASPTPAPAAVEATKPASPKATPSSTPTVVISAVRPPPAPNVEAPLVTTPSAAPAAPPAPVTAPATPPVTAESPTAEIRLDTVPTRGDPTATAPVQALELESPVSGASTSSAPIDGFSLDGLETTSLTANEPAAVPAPAPVAGLDLGAATSTPAPSPEPATLDLDLGAIAAPAAAAPAPASPKSAGPASTVSLDLDFAVPAPAPAAAPASPPSTTHGAPELLDLNIPGPADIAASAAAAAVPELDIGDVGGTQAPPAHGSQELEFLSVPDNQPVAAPEPEAAPFMTETMAELYLQQGHREEALRVYRSVLEQRPADASLRAKVAALESEMAPRSRPGPRAPEPSRAAAHPERVSGPTIREVLSVVALRRPGFRPEPSGHNGSTPAETVRPSIGHDAIGALFGGGTVTSEDEFAAVALALAFAESGGETSPGGGAPQQIAGAPARQASNELSLDSVFGGEGAPAPAAPSSFSFDQFFSQRAAAEGPSGTAGGGTGRGAPEDVAQFTQWLEGLKQR